MPKLNIITKGNNIAQKYLNIMGCIMVVIDAKGKITLINKTGCDILGYTNRQIIGKDWFSNFLPKRMRADVRKVFDKLMKGAIKPVEYFENPVLTKSGKERIIRWHNAVLRDTKGKIIGTLSSGQDITETRRTESELHESEERYKRIFNSTGEALCIIDEEANILEVNPRMCQMHGYSRKELIGSNARKLVHLDDLPLFKKFLSDLREGGRFHAEAKDICKDGSVIDVEVKGDTIEFKGKKCLLGILRDITERKIKEEEIKRLIIKDAHTGCYNHRYLEDILEIEFNRAKRNGQALSAIMIDIDYFKSINEVYGHPFGDLILKQFAAQLKRMVRIYDIVARYGGEEFVVLCPGASKEETMKLAQRLLDAINLYNFGTKENVVKLKLSMAVSSYPDDVIVRPDDIIKLGEKILEKTKEAGGNRVCCFSDITKGEYKQLAKAGDTEDIKRLKGKIDKLTKRANQSLAESILAFAKTLELKDHYTGSHVERTVSYAVKIAEEVRLSSENVEWIKKAAILHDLGKIGISEKILNKKGVLTKKEFDIVKKHPQIGVDIFRPIQSLHNVIPFILYHHEWWNGKGYPHALKAEEIPLGARIIAVADAYQALTSRRSYRKAYSPKEALEIIKEESGTKFDPRVVKAFLKIVRK